MFLAPDRVRDQRRRADAEHLRGRQHEEHQIAADGDCRDRIGAETSDPIQIDQHVQR